MASHGYSSGSHPAANNPYNPPTPPRNAHVATANNSYPAYTGHQAYYSNSHPAPLTPPHGFQPAPTSPKSPTEPVAFFMFFNCKTTGTNIHKDRIVELSLQCWPYIENAPTFHSKVDIGQGRPNKVQGKNKRGQKKGVSHPDDSVGHPFPVVWKHLMQWLDRILNHATNVIGTQIYPVLVAHHGDTYDFHFLFTALEEHGIALDAPSKLNICFCDPVPLLKQYKEYAHPWLVESRSMSLGSLLNDWLPGQFDIGDLYICPGKTLLAAKLYTQTPMYWLLKEFPVYTTEEWIEYYNEVKLYREDKKSLEDNFPPNVPEVQRKFAVRSLLQWGYNWEGLVDLYKSCTSPEHFRQEMKDCDLKSGPASQLTWKFVDEKIPQDGTRQYQVRIKENMPPQRYTHLTDRRGRWWILRVKNVLPPCIYSINDLFVNLPTANQWRAPENLLLIRFPEAWYPSGVEGQAEDEIIEELHLGDTVYNSDEDSDSLDSWDEEEDEEAALRQSLQPIEDLVKEQPAPPPITTLQFGDQSSAYNPFAERQQKDLQEELRKEENAKRIKDMWESVKGAEKQPSSFGQAIKFCRPGGSEVDKSRKQKEDKDDGNVDKNRKGKRNKQQGEKGPRSGKGRPDRTLGRSQSWTPDNNKKSNEGKQEKPRTVSCSAESWDDETSSTPVEPMSKRDKTTPQTKDEISAVTRRMINFHLAGNNKKSRNRKGRQNNRSDRYQEKQQTNRYTKGNDSREGNVERKHNTWGNPQNTQSSSCKWNDTSRGWGSQSKATPAVNNTTGSTLSAPNQSQAWGPVSNCPVQNKIEDGQFQEEEWGADSDSLQTLTPSCKPSDSNRQTISTHENPCNLQRLERDQQEVKNNAWSNNRAHSDIKAKEMKESENGPEKPLGRSGNHGSNGGVRRPKEVSKAQALANKVSVQGKASVEQPRSLQPPPPQGDTSAKASVVQPASQPQQQPQATQLTQPQPTQQPNASATVLGQRSTPLGVQSKTKYGTPPRNKMQSQNTRHGAGSRNNREQNFRPGGNSNFSKRTGVQKTQGGNDKRFGQSNRSSNSNWREQGTNNPQSTAISQPVVTNSFEETENWDEEIGDDECYGL